MLENLGHTIAILIFRDIIKKESNLLQLGKPFNTGTQIINKVVQYIKENYQKECTLEELSEIAGMRFYLIRIFKEYMVKHLMIIFWILELRMQTT